jgi:hypothetical protein
MDRNIEIENTTVKDDRSSIEQEQESSRNARTWRDFAELINAAWRKSAQSFVDVGQYLIEAKEELARDQYDSLLKFKIAFSQSTAKKLICIGRNRILGSHVNRLPGCYSTLYLLSQIDDKLLKAALANGRIHPGMQRKDAVALRKPKNDEGDDGQDYSNEPARNIASPAAPPHEFLEDWQCWTAEEQRTVLKHEGVDGLLELLKEDAAFLAELYDRVIGLQVALASPVVASKSSKNLLTNLTGTLHWALGKDDPASGAQALKIIKAKLIVNKRDPKDICFSFAKTAKR